MLSNNSNFERHKKRFDFAQPVFSLGISNNAIHGFTDENLFYLYMSLDRKSQLRLSTEISEAFSLLLKDRLNRFKVYRDYEDFHKIGAQLKRELSLLGPYQSSVVLNFLLSIQAITFCIVWTLFTFSKNPPKAMELIAFLFLFIVPGTSLALYNKLNDAVLK